MISLEEAKAKVPDKKALYEALLRNGYFMPPYSNRIITIQYMEKVKSGEVYVPKYDIVRLRPCPNPPVKKRVFDEILKEMTRVGLKFGLKNEGYASTDWLLAILSTCNQEHEFFWKSYTPSSEDSKYSRVKRQTDCSNADGFYDGLPVKKQRTVNLPLADPAGVNDLMRKLTKMKLMESKFKQQ